MKTLNELKFEELTFEQKIGMAMVASVRTKESFEQALELVKKTLGWCCMDSTHSRL